MKRLQVPFFFLFLFIATSSLAQKPENWTKNQLEEPATLALRLQENKDVPLILSVGPGAAIPHSISIGPVSESANADKLKTTLQGLDRDTSIIVYCGCCPFEHCPNVRPAIEQLKAMHFTNYKLLNLPHNIKTDWIDKGYPAAKL